MLCDLSATGTAIACVVTLVASATALAITLLVITYLLAIITLFLCLPKWDFYYWHHVVYLAQIKIFLSDVFECVYYHIMSAFVTGDMYKCMCLYIQWWCHVLAYVLISNHYSMVTMVWESLLSDNCRKKPWNNKGLFILSLSISLKPLTLSTGGHFGRSSKLMAVLSHLSI